MRDFITNNKPLINCVIAGAQKSGTTALAYYLSLHNNIYVPNEKELHIFDDDNFNEKYCDTQSINTLVAKVKNKKIICDATPIYIFLPECLPRIKAYNPNLKIIVLLRDPLERAVSQYNMEVARGDEKLPIALAFLLEMPRLYLFSLFSSKYKRFAWRHYSYIQRSLYTKQMNRLKKLFTDEQILILRHCDLKNQHAKTLRRIYSFLGLEIDVLPPKEIIFQGARKTKLPRAYGVLLKTLLKNEYRYLEGL